MPYSTHDVALILSGEEWLGTGTLVAPGRLLTAYHVVFGKDGQKKPNLQVRLEGDTKAVPALVSWAGSLELDVAVLEANIERVPPRRPLLDLSSDNIATDTPWEAHGYPAVRDTKPSTRLEQVRGKAGSFVHGNERQNLDVDAAPEKFNGLSGAAVIIRDRIVGVIRAVPSHWGGKRLEATPVDAFFGDSNFRKALGIDKEDEIGSPAGGASVGTATFVEYLSHGINALTTDYAARLQRFIEEYVGHDDVVIPFGGRERELQWLDAWLDRGSAPYNVLTAPAGQGKSALLIRWCLRIAKRSDVSIALLPISIRFETNLANVAFAMLASRLAYLHGENVPQNYNMTVDNWRGLVCQYLVKPLRQGQKVVIIIDGLDEAAGIRLHNILPRRPTAGLHIFISARLRPEETNESWLRELGLQGFGVAQLSSLEPLTMPGISDVLKNMGVPLDTFGDRGDVIATLHKLTQGDPLLINLYIEELAKYNNGASTATASVLEKFASKPKGLDGFIARWWEEQQSLWRTAGRSVQPVVSLLLNILSCALGPLSRNDIEALLRPKDAITSLTLEDALQALRRFVLGDGKRMGYVFSHPKLAAHFYDKLLQDERAEIEQRFIEYGRQTVAKLENCTHDTLSKLSPYIIQRYGDHLTRSGYEPAAFFPLVTRWWKDAWEAIEGSFAGFLSDVDRAFEAASTINKECIRRGELPPYLDLEILCILCHASVNSLTNKISPSLAALLVRFGHWTISQGIAFERQIRDPRIRAIAISNIAPLLPDHERCTILEELLLLPSSETRTEAIVKIVPEVAPFMVPRILDEMQYSRNPWEKVRVLSAISGLIPETQVTRGINFALAISDDRARAAAISHIISRAHETKQIELVECAIEALRSNIVSGVDGQILATIIQSAPIAYLPTLEWTARNSKLPEIRARLLGAIALRKSRSEAKKLLREAIALARKVTNAAIQEELLLALRVQSIKVAGNAVKAELIHSIVRAPNAWSLAIVLIENPAIATEVISNLRATLAYEFDDASLLVLRSFALRPPRSYSRIVRILEKLASSDYADDDYVANAISILAPHLPKGCIPQAWEIVEQIREPQSYATAFVALAHRIDASLRNTVLEGMQKEARAIGDKPCFATTRLALACHLPPSNVASLDIWALSGNVTNIPRRIQLLTSLLLHLDGAQRQDVLNQTLASLEVLQARNFDESDDGDIDVFVDADAIAALTALAPYLGQEELQQALEFAEELSDDPSEQSDVILQILPHAENQASVMILSQLMLRAASSDEFTDDDRLHFLNAAANVKLGLLLPEFTEMLMSDQYVLGTYTFASIMIRILRNLPRCEISAKPHDALVAAWGYLGKRPPSEETSASLRAALHIIRRRLGNPNISSDKHDLAWLALAEIAPYLSDDTRRETIERYDFFEIAESIRDNEMAAEVLISLSPYCESDACLTILADGLEAIRRATRMDTRSTIWTRLETRLWHAFYIASLYAVSQVEIGEAAVRLRLEFLHHVASSQREAFLRDTIDIARSIPQPVDRFVSMCLLTPWLPVASRERVLQEVLVKLPTQLTLSTYTKLLEALGSQTPRLVFFERAISTARTRTCDDEEFLEFMKVIAPKLAPEMYEQWLELFGQSSIEARARIIAGKVLTEMPRTMKYALLHDMLSSLRKKSRPDVLSVLDGVFPLLADLAGIDAMHKVDRVLLDAAQWWP